MRRHRRHEFCFRSVCDFVDNACDCLQLLEGVKAKSATGKDQVKGAAVKKVNASPKESELQAAEAALQSILNRQASDL